MPDDDDSESAGSQGKAKRVTKRLLAFIAVLTFACGELSAQELSWHGFVQSNYSLRTSRQSPGGSDFQWADNRLQLKLSVSEGDARAFAKVDFFQDDLAGSTGQDIREVFLDYSAGSFDFRLGKQIMTWGLGDLLFVNDVFPKDWQAFFSGRPVEYLKVGAGAFKTTFTTSVFSTDLAIMPFFEPDNLPTPRDFIMYDPFSSITSKTESRPDSRVKNIELAARVYANLSGYEVALYSYRGVNRMPAALPDSLLTNLTYFYPKLSVYGSSLQKSIYGGIVSLEYGYADSRQDRCGTNPMIPNSFHKFLFGVQRQGWNDFTYSFQFYGEYMSRFDRYEKSVPQGLPRQDRFRKVLTSRFTQLLKYQTWKISLFAFYSPTDRDYYLIPEAQYKFSDKLWLSLGGNIFGGENETTFFGQFDKNDNAYTILRYSF